jgi:head-tail adaptor
MRRAPAWLVSELLSKYPESANLTTNLGEYPLHLAVDKACAPEVVNLIIVANWNAIVSQDQAGRTPLDIVDRDELIQIEDYRIIFESLGRCHRTYVDIQKATHEEKVALTRKQKLTFNAVSKRHREELKVEYDKQAKLQKFVEDLKKEIENMKELTNNKDDQIEKHMQQKDVWLAGIRELESKEACQRCELESERTQVKNLLYKIERKEDEIRGKDTHIHVLSKDLRSIAVSNETDVMESLIETEQSMRTMVSNQIALQQLLSSKSRSLKSLLKQRGIAVLKIDDNQQMPEEEKSTHGNDDDNFVEDDAASAAMMAAALTALHPTATGTDK